MSAEYFKLKIVLILTVGFALGSLFGYLSNKIKLSPIFGYLVAGYMIGPYSPGFVADLGVSEQLAEIGVVLMMFGVGLHLKWQDLLKVKNVAIPGAIGQTLVATFISAFILTQIGWSIEAGIVFGLAIGVASTMVMVRVLSDFKVLRSPQGYISLGWLVVEDFISVLILLLMPTIAAAMKGETFSLGSTFGLIAFALAKFAILAIVLFTFGRRIVCFILSKIEKTHSYELFTITILATTFVIATGSVLIFGTSIALGAFLAGMVIGQTDVRHKVSARALPIRDIFVVIFFLSVGMLFNPIVVWQNPVLFVSILITILIAKPLSAFLISYFLKYPIRTSLGVAIALAQVGEFSFILAEEAIKYHILPEEGYDIIVACALVSISINPLLFKFTGQYKELPSR